MSAVVIERDAVPRAAYEINKLEKRLCRQVGQANRAGCDRQRRFIRNQCAHAGKRAAAATIRILMQQLSPPELRAWLDDAARVPPILLDVREEWELERCRIDGATWIPMRDVPRRMEELNPKAEVVVICHHGVRSYHVAITLKSK